MTDRDQNKEEQLDELLDSLLSTYSAVEPRPGLETRILASTGAAAARKPSAWKMQWLWAGAGLAAVLTVAALIMSGHHPVAPPARTVVQSVQPVVQQPAVQGSVPATAGTERVSHRYRSLAPVPPQDATLALSQRPAVFPTPTPLSEQERLLLSYYSSTPREEVIAQSHPDEPPVVGDQDQTEAIPDLTHIPQKVSNTR